MTPAKDLLVFGVGMTSPEALDHKQFEALNQTGDKVKKLFYLRGA